MKGKKDSKGKKGRKDKQLKKEGKKAAKLREKEIAEFAKKCCHPDRRSCKNCPLKGF